MRTRVALNLPMFEWNPSTIFVASAVGGAVGFLSGLFGVGGGFLLVPILNAVLGVPMSIAVGSTACYTLGPATTAMLVRKPRTGFLELPLILSGGLFVGRLDRDACPGLAAGLHVDDGSGPSPPCRRFDGTAQLFGADDRNCRDVPA